MKLTCDCGKVIRVPDESSGKRFRCPECGAIVRAAQKRETGNDTSSRRGSRKNSRPAEEPASTPLWKKPLFLGGVGGGVLLLIILIVVLTAGGGGEPLPSPGKVGGVMGPEAALESARKLRAKDSPERVKAQQDLRNVWPQLTPAAKEAATDFLARELDDPTHGAPGVIVTLLQGMVEPNLAMPVLEKQLLDKQRNAPKHPQMLRLIEAYFHHAQANNYSVEAAHTLFLAAAARMGSGYASDYKMAMAASKHARERLKAASKQAVPLLVAAVEQRQPGFDWAIALLGEMGADSAVAVPALRLILEKEPDSAVRFTAIRALGEIGPAAAAAFPDLLNLAKSDRSLRVAQEAIPKIASADKVDVPTLDALLQIQEDRSNSILFVSQDTSLVLWILRGLENREQDSRQLADRLRTLQKNLDQQIAVYSRPKEGKRVTVFVKGKLDREATERARERDRKAAVEGEKNRQRHHANLLECQRLLQRVLGNRNEP